MTTTADTATTAADRVRRGAELLDQHQPGWAERIDIDQLALADECHCVLGQLNGGFDADAQDELPDPDPYAVGAAALELATVRSREDHGFTITYTYGDLAEEWAELDRLWAAEIRARQGAATA